MDSELVDIIKNIETKLEELRRLTKPVLSFEEAAVLWPDDQVHVKVDVSNTVEAKWSALRAHRTQFGSSNIFRRIPEEVAKEIMSREYFVQAWPEPPAIYRLSHLFDGLDLASDGVDNHPRHK